MMKSKFDMIIEIEETRVPEIFKLFYLGRKRIVLRSNELVMFQQEKSNDGKIRIEKFNFKMTKKKRLKLVFVLLKKGGETRSLPY